MSFCRHAGLTWLWIVAGPLTALAGGPTTTEISARGAAAQGSLAAAPDDAATVFYNPAGLTELRGSRVELNPLFTAAELEYDHPTASGVESNGRVLGSTLFASTDAVDGIALGIGIYAPFAREVRLPASPATLGARHSTSVLRLDVAPAAAVRIGRRASIGLAVVASQVSLRSEAVGLEESSRGMGFTANVGVLVAVTQQLRVGLTYRGPLSARIEGRSSFAGARSGYHARLRFPATAALALAWSPTPRLTIGVALEQERWSYLRRIRRHYDDPAFPLGQTTRFDGEDALTVRIGAAIRLGENDELRFGYAHAETTFPAGNTTPALADPELHGFSVGYTRRVGRLSLTLMIEHVRGERRTTPNATYPGAYSARGNAVQAGIAYSWPSDR